MNNDSRLRTVCGPSAAFYSFEVNLYDFSQVTTDYFINNLADDVFKVQKRCRFVYVDTTLKKSNNATGKHTPSPI